MQAFLEKDRDKWLEMPDDSLLSICDFSMQKRSGKGGQKINKTSSAVRLVHEDSGISVISAESRYQFENRSNAVKKMKRQMALQIRCPSKGLKISDDVWPSLKNPVYPKWIAQILDIMEENSYSIADSAAKMTCSSSRLVKILSREPDLCQKVNDERKKRGIKPLTF